MKIFKKCVECGRNVRIGRKLDLCSQCQARNVWKKKYEELKAEFEQHKKCCGAVLLDYYKRLKKHEPDIKWGDEPELFMKEK